MDLSSQETNPQIGSWRAWFIWSLAALTFGYAFFQRVVPSVMVQDLMAEFAISATVLGTLSSLYFYPYVVLQIPLGVLIDRWGARLLLTIALTIAGLGSALFATATSVEVAYIGRFVIGVGSAVGFLGSLAIASKWFPQNRFALLAGMVMFFGMMSAVLAQGPLATLVDSYGWRGVIWGLGVSGLVLAAMIALFVRNSPEETTKSNAAPKQSWKMIGQGFKEAASDWNVWKIALVACTMSGPMLTLGALWGTPYMQAAYGLDRATAASSVSILFFAWALGAPFAGWLSDRIKKRKALLVAGSAILTLTMGVLVFGPTLPLTLSLVAFAIIGASGGAMAVTFALVRECSPSHVSTSVTGIVNSLTVASGAVLQPVVGYLLDLLWSGKMQGGIPVYQASEYRSAFIAIFIACLAGFLITLSLRETPFWNSDTK